MFKKPFLKKPIPKKTNKILIKKTPPQNNNIIQPYQHFIIIRFSLAFAKGNLQKMEYTLNNDRLEKRFKLFENICLPSLTNQIKKDNVTVIINITDNMPEKWKNKLYELIDDHEFIQIQEFDHKINENLRTCLHNKYLEKYIKPETKIIATSRLDDDDAFTKNFTDIISNYMKLCKYSKWLRPTIYILIVATAVYLPRNLGWTQTIEMFFYDLLIHLRPAEPIDERIVIWI